MKPIRITLFTFMLALAFFSLTRAQSNEPLAIIMTAEDPLMPPLYEYIN